MILLDNSISKVFYKDTENSYSILLYINVDKVLTSETILNYVNQIVIKNPILKKTIIEKYEQLFLEDVKSIDIKDYYRIEYTNYENFDSYIYDMLNSDFDKKLKWNFLFCIDKTLEKTIIYFKIHHAYVDGDKIKTIILSPFQKRFPL